MRKLTYTVLITLFSMQAIGQKIVRDEVDKFTKTEVKETSREMLHLRALKSVLRFDMRKVDDDFSLGLWVSLRDPFFIAEGSNLYLLLEDETTVLLNCISGGVANNCSGDYCYARFDYALPLNDLYKLLGKKIISIRLDLKGREYIEFDGIKDKNAEKFIKSIQLLAKK